MKKMSLFSDQLRAVWMLAFVAIALVFATPLFLQPSNMLNVLLTAAVVALIAGGRHVIILARSTCPLARSSASAPHHRKRDQSIRCCRRAAQASRVGAGGLINGVLVTKAKCHPSSPRWQRCSSLPG
jgi:ribose transport system permease protein